MKRQSRVYKNAYNRLLDVATHAGVGAALPPETVLAERLSVSRTTIRAALQHMDATGILHWRQRQKEILRRPEPADYFAAEEAVSTQDKIEAAFAEYVAGQAPGTIMTETQLAARFGVGTSALREFLIRFSRFGLIDKEPNKRWILKGMTPDFIDDVFNIRELLELRALAVIAEDWQSPHVQADLRALAKAHQTIRDGLPESFPEFRNLDERFHRHLLTAMGSRLVDGFLELLSIVCFRPTATTQESAIRRSALAIDEHLAILHALLNGDGATAQRLMSVHLQGAREIMRNRALRMS